MGSFITSVQSFSVCGTAAPVYGYDVFDDAVDAGTELSAFGDGGDAAGGWILEVAHYIDDLERMLVGERAVLWEGG